MKKIVLAGLFLCAGVFALYAQNLPSLHIVNNTGYAIYHIYISPASSDEWGDERLGEVILEDGQTFTVRLSQPLSAVNVYDFGVSDEEGDIYYKWEVTITNNARIVFTLDDLYSEEE